METKDQNIKDRVRKNTSVEKNIEIDQQTESKVKASRKLSKKEITNRLEKLRKEWDIEQMFELNASSISLGSLVLGTMVNKRWLILSGIVAGFLFQHSLQGWCPPLPIFRALGYRTRQEIDEEIYALKVLRGDFDAISASSKPDEVLERIRS